jgi:dipeptidase E
MRMYLSSFRLGRYANVLTEMIGSNLRAAMIENALDYIPVSARKKYAEDVYDPIKEMAERGVSAEYLDLRDYFGEPTRLKLALKEFGLVWVLGGNSFLLLKAMKLSGFDEILRNALSNDELVYGGFSAGAVVMTPTLDGIHLMDDPNLSVDGYPDEVDWRGLALFPECIVPHFASPHPEAEAAERAAFYMKQQAIPHVKLRDGEVIVVRGGKTEILR